MDKVNSLRGINYDDIEQNDSLRLKMQIRERVMLEAGVVFRNNPSNQVPWHLGTESFSISENLYKQLCDLGSAFFKLFDWVQLNYNKNKRVEDLLRFGVLPELRGLALEEQLKTFRLDIILRNGIPIATELEEVYGNVGKLYAMDLAYNAKQEALFRMFASLNLTHIVVDDSVGEYIPELQLLVTKLHRTYKQNVKVQFLSEWSPSPNHRVWRFCYSKDFVEYDISKRKLFLESNSTYINGLFHGYGAKSILAIINDKFLEAELKEYMGSELFASPLNGTPRSLMLEECSEEELIEFINNRKKWELRIVDCREDLSLNWGSRGVDFGDVTRSKWETLISLARKRQIKVNESIKKADFMLTELIESDRFDIIFWSSEERKLLKMPRGRIRLGPIFFRSDSPLGILVGGHATFVNTSRKVHLGRHAVCVPMELPHY